MSYYLSMEVADIGEYLNFFAVPTLADEHEWQYDYTLTLRSSALFGSNGDDFLISSGHVHIDDPENCETFLAEFAEEHKPVIPLEIEQEFHDDELLCEIGECYRPTDEKDFDTFKNAYMEVMGQEDDEYTIEECKRLLEYARAHYWDF